MLVPVYGRRMLWKSRPSCHQLYGWLHRLSSGNTRRAVSVIIAWSRLLTNEPQVSNNKRTGLGEFLKPLELIDPDLWLLIVGRIYFWKTRVHGLVLNLSQTFLKMLQMLHFNPSFKSMSFYPSLNWKPVLYIRRQKLRSKSEEKKH